mmetsp:Transcript_11272/g.15866  ORF Transcript_11272/g.15866 Transcript_11272/m.15866 type:complete len:309 (+) Transcript_11272:46-972(+)
MGTRSLPCNGNLRKLLPLLGVILVLTKAGQGYSIDRLMSSSKCEFSTAITTNNDNPCENTTNRRRIISTLFSGAVVGNLPKSSFALSPNEASEAYDQYAKNYNDLDGGVAPSLLGIDEARTKMLGQAKGNVLEIGVGTGLNLDRYNPAYVSSLTLVDISEGMLREAKAKIEHLNLLFKVTFYQADATSQLVDLFGKNSFDTVVDTFSLCVMGNDGAKQCIQQLSEVVKCESDGGRVLLLENSRSSNAALGLYQDLTAQTAASAGGKGCVYNQNVIQLIKSIGTLGILEEEAYAAGLFRSFTCTKRNNS